VGKFCGAALTLVVPLIAGFVIAGTLVGVAARDASFALFLKLSISTIAIGIIFGAIGTAVSVFARSRIHALVFILLVWGVAVFAFDLVALGVKRFQQSAARFQRNRDDLRCDAHQ
jgi:ABC-type transport system involved in multi-copper enzyme maturation permease subunit